MIRTYNDNIFRRTIVTIPIQVLCKHIYLTLAVFITI